MQHHVVFELAPVRHRLDDLEIVVLKSPFDFQVRHRLDDLETEPTDSATVMVVRHRLDDLES